ncbi:Pre-rRNA-processing protein ipi1 [Aspergillus coremiiformis]|uniref:Pre-rRNA-processing protein n=1 Tax=Aspergillus coremiiformis TaxID=138285 RepID=A0A5N6YUG4_9EURO|nr:Pre-rRNA-processing protein ipi1 [Aspergillus coremiiformis]
MGSSSKKKKEKQKDFKKATLKVGKAKGKPENFTDTSFKSKAIVLNQQSLTIHAPTSTTQFTHHISLLSSKSDSQRRDALGHLATSISARPVHSPLPQPVSVILPTLLPLILDANTGVRTHLLKLFRVLPAADIRDHVPQLLPYIRAGMTHLAADIRVSAVETLSWLVAVAGSAVVSCAGGWIKTLNCFLSVLGWHTEESAKWSANRASFGKSGSKGAPMMKVVTVLAEFLAAGVGAPREDLETGDSIDPFPLGPTRVHMVPDTAAPYAYLNLFGQPRDEEGEMYETWEDRYRVFAHRFLPALQRGLENARQEGGEMGRASSGASKVLKEAVAYGQGIV